MSRMIYYINLLFAAFRFISVCFVLVTFVRCCKYFITVRVCVCVCCVCVAYWYATVCDPMPFPRWLVSSCFPKIRMWIYYTTVTSSAILKLPQDAFFNFMTQGKRIPKIRLKLLLIYTLITKSVRLHNLPAFNIITTHMGGFFDSCFQNCFHMASRLINANTVDV